MNERREMSYWAFEAGKWTKIDYVNRQVVPKVYDTFSKKFDLTELLQKMRNWKASEKSLRTKEILAMKNVLENLSSYLSPCYFQNSHYYLQSAEVSQTIPTCITLFSRTLHLGISDH